MTRLLAMLIMVFGSRCIDAQIITVTDQENNEPLELVTIISQQPQAISVTDGFGQADLTAFMDAEEITFSLLGYEDIFLSYAEISALHFKLEMERSALSLEEVVISATKWKQSSGNSPVKVVSISAEEVTLQNPQTAADLLGISGKVYIQKSQQGGGSPMIRGFATNRLLYTVDGVRMNTAIFRGGNIQNVINLDPFAIASTEVFFGPGSLLYGSDAIGGVMSFSTLEPHFGQSGSLLFSGKVVSRFATANQEKTGHIDFNVGSSNLAITSSFTYWDYNDLKQGSHGPEDYVKPYYIERINGEDRVVQQDDPLTQRPTAYDQINTMQKVRYRPSENWDLQYGFHYSTTSSYGRYDRHNRQLNGLPWYGQWDYGPQKWMMNNLKVLHQNNGLLFDEVSLILAYQRFEESRLSRNFNSLLRNEQYEKIDAYSMNLDFINRRSDNHTLYYGVEYVKNDVHSTGLLVNIANSSNTSGPSRYPLSDWSSLGFYLNDQYKWNDEITLQAGLRWNQYQIEADFETDFYPLPFTKVRIDNSALSASMGAVWRPSSNLVISSNLGTAFRSPNVDDIGKIFDSEPGAVTVPNPDLKAERAYNMDLNVAKIFNNDLKIDLSAFYTTLDNAMVRRNYQLDGKDSIIYEGVISQVQAIQNAAVARVYGFQASLEARITKAWRWYTTINHQVGREELDSGEESPSRHAAPFFGTSRLTYNQDKWRIQVYSQYQAKRSYDALAYEERGKEEIYAKDDNGNNYSPAWWTVNIKGQYQFSDHFTANAGIENILDKRYRPYSSGISAPGRNFIFSIQAKW